MAPFTHENQQSYEYHVVDTFEIRTESRKSGCWTTSSIKLIQLCCIGIMAPLLLIVFPIYARFFIYSDSVVPLSFTETRLLNSSTSTVWCQGQKLHMNVSFDAYLMSKQPNLSLTSQNVSIIRHFELDDDLKEYWGFYLLKGSKLTVTSCSRFLGASMTLVKSTSYHSCTSKDSGEAVVENAPKLSHKNEVVQGRLPRHLRKNENASELPIPRINENRNDSDLSRTLNEDISDNEDGAYEEEDRSAEQLNDHLKKNVNEELPNGRGGISQTLLNKDFSSSDESLTSSSEEALLNCADAIFHQPLISNKECNNLTYHKYVPTGYTIPSEGYYYIVFSSSYEKGDQEKNPVSLKIEIQKTAFNTSDAIASCRNVTDCHFPLSFGSTQQVVVSLPGPADGEISTADEEWDAAFRMESECVPRTPVYLIFGLSLPVILVICTFL